MVSEKLRQHCCIQILEGEQPDQSGMVCMLVKLSSVEEMAVRPHRVYNNILFIWNSKLLSHSFITRLKE
jgi:hypothetical protein